MPRLREALQPRHLILYKKDSDSRQTNRKAQTVCRLGVGLSHYIKNSRLNAYAGRGCSNGYSTLYISQSTLGLCGWVSSKSQAPPNLVRRMEYYFYDKENGIKRRRAATVLLLLYFRVCSGWVARQGDNVQG